MLKRVKNFIKKTPLAKPLIYLKGKVARPRAQNDEAQILQALLTRYEVPKRFVEIGFGGWEFNCAPLAYEWEGLLIDGDSYNVTIANTILPKRVRARQMWVTLESIKEVREFAKDLGILSIDVDGNDYWFWDALIDLKPAILIAEYNSTFGLRPITVPYDPAFNYRDHEGWTYYGASLTALSYLAEKNGYCLIEVSTSGVNAFFVRQDLLTEQDRPLDAAQAYREQSHADGSRPAQRWEKIKHLPYVDVTT